MLETGCPGACEADRPREDRADLEREVERLTAEIAAMKTARRARERPAADQVGIGAAEAEFKAAGGRHWEARDDRKRRIGAQEGDRRVRLPARRLRRH